MRWGGCKEFLSEKGLPKLPKFDGSTAVRPGRGSIPGVSGGGVVVSSLVVENDCERINRRAIESKNRIEESLSRSHHTPDYRS